MTARVYVVAPISARALTQLCDGLPANARAISEDEGFVIEWDERDGEATR